MSDFWASLTFAERQQIREAHAEAKEREMRGELGEPCPVCAVPMTTEDGLWYCAGCDAYHGEADEDAADLQDAEAGQ